MDIASENFICEIYRSNHIMLEEVEIFHTITENDSFDKASNDLFKLLVDQQKKRPNKSRVLYVDIKGHRNRVGGFDQDMYRLQMEYGKKFLVQFFKEVHFPLYSMKNVSYQNNNIPKKLRLNVVNEDEMSLERLYIENYSNTEFVSEQDVYCYLKHFSDFLRYYSDWNWNTGLIKNEKFDEKFLMNLWFQHLKNIINEIFNNFIYGNLLSATAMTRTLIECYVYISILVKEKNQWLLSIVKPNKYGSVTFNQACQHLGKSYIYKDYQNLSSFIHGQDVYSKMMPFSFYSSIYEKLYLISEY